MQMNLDFLTIMAAFGLTLAAGMSTALGSLLAFLTKSTNKKFLSGSLGLSAGVMIYVSFMELLPEAIEKLSTVYEDKLPTLYAIMAFFAGMLVIAIIDWLIPEDENPHEMHTVEQIVAEESRLRKTGGKPDNARYKRTGFMIALAIGIHNFPEGVASFVSALNGIEFALPVVIAITIHNIPEGIAVSVPIYHATGDRNKAFTYSLISGLAEPAGALIALFVLIPFWNPEVDAWLLAAVAGVMVYISVDELLPAAEEYGHHHAAVSGVVAGMAIMAVSLLLL